MYFKPFLVVGLLCVNTTFTGRYTGPMGESLLNQEGGCALGEWIIQLIFKLTATQHSKTLPVVCEFT